MSYEYQDIRMDRIEERIKSSILFILPSCYFFSLYHKFYNTAHRAIIRTDIFIVYKLNFNN
jgi:hypothetical protein